MNYIPKRSSKIHLRTWFFPHEKKDELKESNEESKVASILLLDGGVSTYLESEIVSTKKQNHKQNHNQNENQNEKKEESAFSHRELWSSSLLLNKKGQDRIRNCHFAFYNSGADIVSTVTYQCHYLICHCQNNDKNNNNNNNNDGHDHGDGQNDNDNDNDDNVYLLKEESINELDNTDTNQTILLVEDDIDEMLRIGVRIAKEEAVKANNRFKDRNNVDQKESSRYVAASIGCYGGALADGSEYRGKIKMGGKKKKKKK